MHTNYFTTYFEHLHPCTVYGLFRYEKAWLIWESEIHRHPFIDHQVPLYIWKPVNNSRSALLIDPVPCFCVIQKPINEALRVFKVDLWAEMGLHFILPVYTLCKYVLLQKLKINVSYVVKLHYMWYRLFSFWTSEIMVANLENVALLGKFDIVFDNRSIAVFQRSSGCT